MSVRTVRNLLATACAAVALLVGPAVALRYVPPDPPPNQTTTMCATGTVFLNQGLIQQIESAIRARLTAASMGRPAVHLGNDECFTISVRTRANATRIAFEITRPRFIALADSGSTALPPGARVTLACPPSDTTCVPSGRPGSTDLHARPFPVLQVIVSQRDIQPGSAQVARQDGSAIVNYALTSRGKARWCKYTSSHIGEFSPIVLDGRVVSTPQIQAKICGGETQIKLQSAEQSRRIATTINLGGSLSFLKLAPQGAEARAPNGPVESALLPFTCLARAVPLRCYSPGQLRAAYSLQPLLDGGVTGAGRTVVVMAFGTTLKSDLSTVDLQASLRDYDRLFDLPDPNLRVVAPFGGTLVRGAGTEMSLDLEMAHMAAPGAAIAVVLANDDRSIAGSTKSLAWRANTLAEEQVRALRYAVDHGIGDAISLTYAFGPACCAPFVLHDLHQVLQAAREKRVTVLASSGDDGASGQIFEPAGNPGAPRVSLPAADPLVTSVGGTSLRIDPATGSYRGETAWNRQYSSPTARVSPASVVDAASGGGFSSLFPQPSYQGGIGGMRAGRGVPDVAFDAGELTGPASVLSVSGNTYLEPAAGTSVGAPAWAGIVALADQEAGRRLGFLNPAIYRIGRSPLFTRAFHDVVRGNNTVTVATPSGHLIRVRGFDAAPGWDPVTGWGTPNAAVLVPLLARNQRPTDGSSL